MGKFDVKELRGGFRDPRSDETDSRGAAAASAVGIGSRPPSSPADLMQQLGHGMQQLGHGQGGGNHGVAAGFQLDLPPPSPDLDYQSGDAFMPNSLTGDPFGILGTTVSDLFAIERVVAHGGFGVIYRANHLRFAAPVAIKCLKIPNNLSHEEREQFLLRFRKEGEVMFRLSSSIPEVVRPLHLDAVKAQDGRLIPYIAMEWLVGETLKDVIVKRLSEGKRPLSVESAVGLLSPVARALARSHHFPSEEGPLCILHCDLKPDNIFVANVDGGQILKVFDFGIAKVRSAATRQAGGFTVETQSNMFTPAYAAPEQWTPDRYGQTGPWTDVFALALTLTEVVTQKPAIDGPPTAMLSQSVDEKRRPTPRRLGLKVTDRIENIFVKALAVDPKTRYQSIAAFWGALEEALQLPATVGASVRASMTGVAALLPSSWEDEGPAASLVDSLPPAAQAPTFGGELDLQGPAPHPAPAMLAPAAPVPMSGLDFDNAGPSAQNIAIEHHAPLPAAAIGADTPAPLDYAGGIDFADARPERPARPVPSAAGSTPGMSAGLTPGGLMGPPGMGMPGVGAPGMGMPGMPPSNPAHNQDAPDMGQAVPATKERLQAAANKAGQVASQVAALAAGSAANAAKNIATRALAVESLPKIQIDEPSTWIRPMRGPLIALGASIAITVFAVIFSKMTASHFKVSWVSLPLLITSIAFAVYRWVKLTSR